MSDIDNHDNNPAETEDWLDAFEAVVRVAGKDRARFVLEQLLKRSHALGAGMPYQLNTPYINTIPVTREARMPDDNGLGERVSTFTRWNAIATVLRAGKHIEGVGGHISSYASAATLYDVGLNYFFHAASEEHGGDLVFFQGHCSPGIYARAYLEGRINDEEFGLFRQEVEKDGLTSYPHPWLMPNFWQFPTVSMGLGPLQAIYQARFLKYLEDRDLVKTKGRKVWAFCGDGEMDEPESLGAISQAGYAHLDNLIFVINCNLQRLDGPVRGNGHIIQELEAVFRGAGWNVIKVVWGSQWDRLLSKDHKGLLLKRMSEVVDGEYQNFKARDGAYVREHFFGKYPELAEMVADMTDEEIWELKRGGHDQQKMFAAYSEAVKHTGQPTVILAKTVKGYGTGAAGEGLNIAHQMKKMSTDDLKKFRDRFHVPLNDEQIESISFYHPGMESPEVKFLLDCRKKLGGPFPARRSKADVALNIPALSEFATHIQGTGDRAISTTMAFVRILNSLLKDKNIGKNIVPIIPDESRTFGMEGMFRQLGIYSPIGQLYTPVDASQVMYYHEDKKGQIILEGINEAGAFATWMAAATSYSTNNYIMVPFYIYYSMFGFQRIGDLAWAAGDCRARGFLLGGTAGRTTLSGEGLQHQDGHSHLLASTIPNCIAYDPAYSFEIAVIVQEGLRRMMVEQEDVYYYLTLGNENYQHPEMPKNAEAGILKGLYLLQKSTAKHKARVQLLGSGAILQQVVQAAKILESEWDVACDIWSATSFNELRRDALAVERYNRMHPTEKPKVSYVAECLQDQPGPIIAATDYMKIYAEQIRPYLKQSFTALGTDGFGRSDGREALRHFFEVDSKFIILATLKALADEGTIAAKVVASAMKKYEIDPDKVDPVMAGKWQQPVKKK